MQLVSKSQSIVCLLKLAIMYFIAHLTLYIDSKWGQHFVCVCKCSTQAF